jgi:hypothetical protein
VDLDRADLACRFSIPAAGFTAGDKVAVLTGKTTTGRAISGSAPVTILPSPPLDPVVARSPACRVRPTAHRLDEPG